MTTTPLLPSAAAAIEAAASAVSAAASADALAAKAKEEYLLVLKLKRVWDGLCDLLDDPSIAAFSAQCTDSMPTHLRSLVFAFRAMYSRFKEIQASGVGDTLQVLYNELKDNPLVEEERIVEDSLKDISVQLEVVTEEFRDTEADISGQLLSVNNSLVEFSKKVHNFQILAGKQLSRQKEENPRAVLMTAAIVCKGAWSKENRIHALDVMEHVVSSSWSELTVSDRSCVINVGKELLLEIAGPLKAPILTFLSKILRRGGVSLWQEFLPALIDVSGRGPLEAQVICSIMLWIPEEHRGTGVNLPLLLRSLHSLLKTHFDAGLSAKRRMMFDSAQQHEVAVQSAIQVLKGFAPWASLEALMNQEILQGFAFLTSCPDFAKESFEFFQLLSDRVRPVDAGPDYDVAQNMVTNQLSRASQVLQEVEENQNMIVQ